MLNMVFERKIEKKCCKLNHKHAFYMQRSKEKNSDLSKIAQVETNDH
jgi:hypothetical protein